MDLTFWVIQAVLLTPVLFMAASVGMEEPGRARRASPLTAADPERGVATVRRPVSAALAGLSQFSDEQQARLVMLRSFVQEARLGRGSFQDDVAPEPPPTPPTAPTPGRSRRVSSRQLLLAGSIFVVLLGAVGMVRASIAMDELQQTTTSRAEPLSFGSQFLPGVLVSPAKYLSAVNGSAGASGASSEDPLYAVSLMEDKQAMDRWEALALVGLGLLLFLNAMRGGDEEDGSVASDIAPFVLVAAALFAGLSFFELP